MVHYPPLDTAPCPNCAEVGRAVTLEKQANPRYWECPECGWWGHRSAVEDH